MEKHIDDFSDSVPVDFFDHLDFESDRSKV